MAKTTDNPALTGTDRMEGSVYITALGTSPYFQNPAIDATKLYNLQKNVYAAGVAHKQRNLIFQEKYSINAYNPEGEQDETTEELIARLTAMTDQPEVNLWAKMQKAYYDFFFWGPNLSNPVWEWIDNEYVLTKLRRLPPHSFRNTAPTATYRYADILPGITYNVDKQEVEYWQTLDTGDVVQLTNVVMIKDPISEGLAGEPIITPLVPVFDMANFTWQGQMQKVNREAAPTVILRMTNPSDDDLAYGQTFLRNWGKDTAWPLQDNMEIIPLNFNNDATALDTINALNTLIVDYFSPASSISKDGTLIGGSSGPEYELLLAYIRGQQAWIAQGFTAILEPYLIANGYEGYRISIDIPCPSVDKSEVWLKQAEFGLKAGTMSPNELREFGSELPALDDQAWQDLNAQRAVLDVKDSGAPTLTPDQQMDIEKGKILAAMTGNKLDPYAVVPKDTQKRFLQRLIGVFKGKDEGDNDTL